MLKDMGYTVFYDAMMTGDTQWWGQIIKEIRAANVFFYALSPDCIKSPYCTREYEYARALKRRILPVKIKAVDFNQIPFRISERQVVYLDDQNSVELFVKLVWNLNTRLRKPRPPIPRPEPTPPSLPTLPSNTALVLEQITNNEISLTSQDQKDLLAQILRLCYEPEKRSLARDLLKNFRKRKHDLYRETICDINGLLSLLPQPVKPPLTWPKVRRAFIRMPDLQHTVADIDKYQVNILLNLKWNGIETMQQVTELTTSPKVIETLKDLYIEELRRDPNVPLDPSAVASWGSWLLMHDVSSEAVEALRNTLRGTQEYRDRHPDTAS